MNLEEDKPTGKVVTRLEDVASRLEQTLSGLPDNTGLINELEETLGKDTAVDNNLVERSTWVKSQTVELVEGLKHLEELLGLKPGDQLDFQRRMRETTDAVADLSDEATYLLSEDQARDLVRALFIFHNTNLKILSGSERLRLKLLLRDYGVNTLHIDLLH